MKNYLYKGLSCIVVVVYILYCIETSRAADSLAISQSLSAEDYIVSAQAEFRLGFFSPNDSGKVYVGIWYNTIPKQTVVWIANRDSPLNDMNGVLRIGDDGNLILVDGTEATVWSTGVPNLSSKATVVQLLDSGNLVLKERNGGGSFIWQSFEHPSDALLAGMKLGYDQRTGLNLSLTSWKSFDDPSSGDYTFGISSEGLPQAVTWKHSSKKFRSGPWNGKDFGGLIFEEFPFTPVATVNSESAYFGFSLNNTSHLVMAKLTSIGEFQFLRWDYTRSDWLDLQTVPRDYCGSYRYCGVNAICKTGVSRPCSCFVGHTPRNAQQWDTRIWDSGCVRKYPLNCPKGERFIAVEGVKMPDLLQIMVDTNQAGDKCETKCLNNCSCTAYAATRVQGGNGCLFWFGNLIDTRKLDVQTDFKLYIRITAADLDIGYVDSDKNNNRRMIIITVTTISAFLLLLGAAFIVWKRKSHQEATQQGSQVTDAENFEIPCFDLPTIAKATQNFSDVNKIGEGGFGPVYKGVLSNGQEVAIKRLSGDSFQGHRECKTEITLIGKLQHRNLVRILGYCIEGEERILIYEYMPNGSLDCCLFGDTEHDKMHLLVWRNRFSIIVGIARGLLYLHRDSRLRIIHRDLKASNVLLDFEMNPKISDFGMARAFAEKQFTVMTRMIAGTYGYMAPEYALRGMFSMKSDVFSFGVLVLEIVSGQRNSHFLHPEHNLSLLGHAWNLWVEGSALELIDPRMEDSFSSSDVLRCIQVGLLCVQKHSDERPTMSSVLMMLDSEFTVLPQPNRPGFSTEILSDC
ncbi:hypothetical protein Leryth_022339 [Lithospermum erythrorhizon]|nr:hypothetical protein Leryth_022339 [Lithospermum erythrorhizon]